MEQGLAGFLFGCIVALAAGLTSYQSAEATMKQRAVDAGVACYQSADDGKQSFKFNCDKEKK